MQWFISSILGRETLFLISWTSSSVGLTRKITYCVRAWRTQSSFSSAITRISRGFVRGRVLEGYFLIRLQLISNFPNEIRAKLAGWSRRLLSTLATQHSTSPSRSSPGSLPREKNRIRLRPTYVLPSSTAPQQLRNPHTRTNTSIHTRKHMRIRIFTRIPTSFYILL